MYKSIFIMTLLSSMLFSDSILGELQQNGLEIRDKNNKKLHIQRELSPLCTDELIKPPAIFGDEFAGRRVSSLCKKKIVTKIGVLQPINLGLGIKTVGELEVLEHIKHAQENPKAYVLVVVLYCNASWCSQSPNAIYKLINMGYPAEKLMWYRGGLQDWLIYDYTVMRRN